jgi:hypothetical protein
MMKRILGAVAVLLCLSMPAGSEEKYTLSGIVTFQEGEVIFLSLYTHERFMNLRKRPLPPPPFTLVIEPGIEEKNAGRTPFRFEGIPSGTYALMAFRDKKMPAGPALSEKPASAYRMMTFSGQWEDVKFELNRNMTGIEIRFGK